MKKQIAVALVVAAFAMLYVTTVSEVDTVRSPTGTSLPAADEVVAEGILEPQGADDPFEPGLRPRPDPGVELGCAAENLFPRNYTDLDGFRIWRRKAAGILRHSSDPDHLLIAGLLLFEDQASHLALIRNALSQRPGEALYHWHMLLACSASGNCDYRRVEQDAIDLVGDEGAIWVRVAAARAGRGNDAGVTEALRRAIGAAEFNDFFVADVRMIERALAASTGDAFPKRMAQAFDLAAMRPQAGYDLWETCSSEFDLSAELQDLCLQTATRLEAESKSFANSAMALSVQKEMHRLANNDTQYAAVGNRQDAIRELRLQGLTAAQYVVLSSNEHVLSVFLQEFETHGEFAATRYALRETDRLLAEPGFDPCASIVNEDRPATPAQ